MKPSRTFWMALIVAAGLAPACLAQPAAAPQKKTLGLENAIPTAACEAGAKAVDPRQVQSLNQFMASLNQHQATTFGGIWRFTLVSRKQDLGKIINEQQLPDMIRDPSDGKGLKSAIKGLDYLVIPVVTSFSDAQEGIGDLGGVGVVVNARTVKAAGTFKVFDASTGELLKAVSIPVVVDRRGAQRAAPDGGAWNNRAADDAQIDEAAMQLADQAALEVTNAVFPIYVAALFGDEVTISRGQDGRVTVGQVWEIFGEGKVMIDKATGLPLGKQESKIGEIEITNVNENTAVGRIAGRNLGIAEGARARLKPMPMRDPRDPRGLRDPLPR